VATTAETRPEIGIRDLLEAGLHFGHQTKRWNPKMRRFIFDKRNGIHIIDLAKTLVRLQEAAQFVHDAVASGQRVLFVGTKKQAQRAIEETAGASGQYYVTTRWLGGTLTNASTIRRSIMRLHQLDQMEKTDAFASMHKKEAASLRRELEKLRRNLSGIAAMKDPPGLLFVVDITREAIAVAEANRMGIPVVAMVDTNCDPDPIDYVIPGNDDAIRAIKLVAGAIGEAVRSGSESYTKLAAEDARRREAQAKTEPATDKASADAPQSPDAPVPEAPSDETDDAEESGPDRGAPAKKRAPARKKPRSAHPARGARSTARR